MAFEEEDYPGQANNSRRHRIIREAVEAADRIIIDGSNGDVEETDYLTGKVALEFFQKVDSRLSSTLLRHDMQRRKT